MPSRDNRAMYRIRILLLVFLLLSGGGCYRYVRTESPDLAVGAQVRARLTDAGMEEMRRFFGPDVRSVEGPLVRWDAEGMGLLTEISLRRGGFPSTTMADTIRLLPNHIAGVDVREVDGKRTVAFTAGVLGAMAGAIMAARHFGGSSQDSDEGGGPDPEASIIFRIPLRIGFR